ncbi:MAG: TonB-dependent receptor [Sorangiineae bacterium]|nr:TonB-dependent receptor [Polyangiaceae bacterium]MEB2323432.1 TonB-dependent receptor [Sorangiineae bacterium]
MGDPWRAVPALFFSACTLAGPSVALAAPDEAPPAESAAPGDDAPIEVTVRGEAPGSEAASRSHAGGRELALRPKRRPADVVEAVPGLFAVQHAGGGKANQYFLRGFDADHGTDVAFFVDGVPVNLPSHGHGQGYTDLHFFIPELVASVDGYKGPYYAGLGDFATAGAVDVHLAERLPEGFVELGAGEFGILRALYAASPELGERWRMVAAVDLETDRGPFELSEDYRQYKTYLRATHDFERAGTLSATLMSYGARWNGSGQIPARAVCGEGEPLAPPPSAYGAPCLERFGHVDPSEGGRTDRHQLSFAWERLGERTDLSARAYAVKYRFGLYSNFTFFLEDPLRGDEIEQTDDRLVVGGEVRVRRRDRWGGARFTTTGGLQLRSDGIDNGLYHDQARARLEPRVRARIDEDSLGLYLEEDARLTDWLRLIPGLRAQGLRVGVRDHLGPASGEKSAALLLPKLMVVLSPASPLELFLDVGRGFHSNDARGAVAPGAAATLMVPATGAEVGARLTPHPGVALQAAAFSLDMDSELVWVGDAGGTEASGRTRRLGAELGARARLAEWLFIDADATFTRARYRENAGNAGSVALAPTRTLTAGVGAEPRFGALRPFGALRLKALSSRPATPDGALMAEGFTVVDASAGARWRDVELGLDVQNLLGAKWREVQFATETRLAYEPAPVEGIHYTPGWPRTVLARLRLYLR